jgi:hypothetical protein
MHPESQKPFRINTLFQAPQSQTNSKVQNSKQDVLVFSDWCLELIWNLKFGICNLTRLSVTVSNSEELRLRRPSGPVHSADFQNIGLHG